MILIQEQLLITFNLIPKVGGVIDTHYSIHYLKYKDMQDFMFYDNVTTFKSLINRNFQLSLSAL